MTILKIAFRCCFFGCASPESQWADGRTESRKCCFCPQLNPKETISTWPPLAEKTPDFKGNFNKEPKYSGASETSFVVMLLLISIDVKMSVVYVSHDIFVSPMRRVTKMLTSSVPSPAPASNLRPNRPNSLKVSPPLHRRKDTLLVVSGLSRSNNKTLQH